MKDLPPSIRRILASILLAVSASVSLAEATSAPTQEPPSQVMLIQGNTLVPRSVIFQPKWYVLGALGEFGVYDTINQYEGWESEKMLAILKAESHLRADVVNEKDYHKGSGCWGSFGLAQIGCCWFGQFGLTKDNWNDPETNIRVAYEIWKISGYEAWGAYNDKSYLAFY